MRAVYCSRGTDRPGEKSSTGQRRRSLLTRGDWSAWVFTLPNELNIQDGRPAIDVGRCPCASKYGMARPLSASVGYHACTTTWRRSLEAGLNVSARLASVHLNTTLPTR